MTTHMSDYDMALSKAFDLWAPSYEREALQKIRLRGYSYDALGTIIADDLKRYCNHHVVVELGCGPGTLGKRLRRSSNGVIDALIGVDISREMLRKAAATGIYDEVIFSAADKYTFPTATTAVVSSFAFHSIENIASVLSKIKQLPNLRLLDVVDLYPANETELLNSSDHSRKYEYGSPEHYMTVEKFTSFVISEGFRVDKQIKLGISKDYNHWKTTILPDREKK